MITGTAHVDGAPTAGVPVFAVTLAATYAVLAETVSGALGAYSLDISPYADDVAVVAMPPIGVAAQPVARAPVADGAVANLYLVDTGYEAPAGGALALVYGAPLLSTTGNPDQTVDDGTQVTFSVTAQGGAPPYSYQWLADGVEVPGETADTFGFIVFWGDNGLSAVCRVTDAHGETVLSAPSVLTINKIPFEWVAQPMDLVLRAPQTASFYAAAVGGGAVTYQWEEETAGDLPGETSTTLDFEVQDGQDGNRYRLRATDYYGDSYTSDWAELTVLPPIECRVVDVRVLDNDGNWVSIKGEDGDDGDAEALLDDENVRLDRTWSSYTISQELAQKANVSDIPDTGEQVDGGSAASAAHTAVDGGDAASLASRFHTLDGGDAWAT